MKHALMVWGTSSNAGKSLLATALCRWAARQGVDVAPFKAQNMSNNARVVPGRDGGFAEIGAAQYFQALAARVPPSVDMNPVLLKPERDTASQVVLQGEANAALSRLPWRERSARLAVAARDSFERLAARHDLIVIEGAGSPAEINLAPQDYVNLGTARWALQAGGCSSLLVTDIDRGGAFAHLYGTWALLPPDLRGTLAGFVLNKFRGDAGLLAPGPEQLHALTGVPLLGVLPMWQGHGLPEEDGWFTGAHAAGDDGAPRIVVVALPRISNLDEFQPLAALPGVRLVWARCPAELRGARWVVLPGSKQVSGDLQWLHTTGLAAAVQRHAQAGGAVLGICGGLQLLGEWLDDPEGFDGQAHGRMEGLGLLPLGTTYGPAKQVRPARLRLAAQGTAWGALAGLAVTGYEIHHGITVPTGDGAVAVAHTVDGGSCIGWQHGNVLGLYAHGLFESPAVLQALFGAGVPSLDERLDGLADWLERSLGREPLQRLLLP